MAQPSFDFEIITPQGIVYRGSVVYARIPTDLGSVGILAHHAPLVTSSAGGKLVIRESGTETEKILSVGAGIFEVGKNLARFFTASFDREGSSTP